MTPTEKARRSDSLYYDTHGANRRNLCDMIAEREDRIEELEAGNAKLRELLQRTWDAFHDATAREFDTVKNELRKLGIEVDE